MPTTETLERFIARVESNAHAEACERFYRGKHYSRSSIRKFVRIAGAKPARG